MRHHQFRRAAINQSIPGASIKHTVAEPAWSKTNWPALPTGWMPIYAAECRPVGYHRQDFATNSGRHHMEERDGITDSRGSVN